MTCLSGFSSSPYAGGLERVLRFPQVFEDEKTPSVLRTPSIPRTAGAEYLLRGMTCLSGLSSSPYAGGLERVLWFPQVFEDECGLAGGEVALSFCITGLDESFM